MSVLEWSKRRAAFRLTAAVTAGLFLGIGLSTSGALPWSAAPAYAAAPERAPEARAPRRVALFVLAKRASLGGEAKVLQSLMRDELGKLEGVVAVGANGDPVASIAQTAGPLIEAGFRALNDHDGATAEASFRKAYDLITAYRGPFDKRLMARVLKGLGVASVLTGQRAVAEQMINAGLNLWPDQQAAEYGWTLDARGAFREIERKRSEQPLGSVEITSEPDGAEIRVAGELKGFAPIEVQGLAPGPHWFEATIDGYARSGMFVDVVAGQGSIAHIDLDALGDRRVVNAALRNAQRLIRSSKAAAPLSNLQRLTHADAIIVLQVNKRRGSYDFEGWVKTRSAPPEQLQVAFAEDGELLNNLQLFVASTLHAHSAPEDAPLALDGPPTASVMDGDSLYIDPNDPIFREDERRAGEPITDKWWFWAIAGGATVGLVLGGIALFSSDGAGTGASGNLVVDLHRLP